MANERRIHRRDLITVPVTCSYPEGETRKSLTTSGITLNFSDTGLCFYTNTALEEGIELEITSKAIWNTPRKGTVKWCRKITEELYRVGATLS